MSGAIHQGRCLCSAVQFEVRGPLRPVTYCHCQMCRRATGHYLAATACATADLHLRQSDALRWYRSSTSASRGFCGTCGSNLFWKGDTADHVSILPGSLDLPTGLQASKHIFVADAGDYYQIQDGLPQFPQWG